MVMKKDTFASASVIGIAILSNGMFDVVCSNDAPVTKLGRDEFLTSSLKKAVLIHIQKKRSITLQGRD